MLVLVVDRSAAVRARVIARLREAGHVLAGEAATLAEASALIAAQAPDAIVADVELPDGPGVEIVAALRARAPGATVVILTNATHFRPVCLAEGADHFLDKSGEFDMITTVLDPTVLDPTVLDLTVLDLE